MWARVFCARSSLCEARLVVSVDTKWICLCRVIALRLSETLPSVRSYRGVTFLLIVFVRHPRGLRHLFIHIFRRCLFIAIGIRRFLFAVFWGIFGPNSDLASGLSAVSGWRSSSSTVDLFCNSCQVLFCDIWTYSTVFYSLAESVR